jgi:hypothetical protein
MSRIQPESLHHGKATSARSTGAATKAKADDQDDQEGDVAGEDLPGRRQRRADRLRDAEHNAADQRAPHVAEPADDHRLESQDEPDRPGRRIENRPDGEQHAGYCREDHGDAQRQRVELAVVDAHEFRGIGIV